MDKIVYQNQDWVVYRDRMEAADGSYTVQMYLHEKRQESELWDWPLHMAEKTWVNIETFAPAFLELLKVRGVAIDAALLMTFYKIGQDEVRDRLFAQATIDLNARRADGSLDLRRMMEIDEEVQRRLGGEGSQSPAT